MLITVPTICFIVRIVRFLFFFKEVRIVRLLLVLEILIPQKSHTLEIVLQDYMVSIYIFSSYFSYIFMFFIYIYIYILIYYRNVLKVFFYKCVCRVTRFKWLLKKLLFINLRNNSKRVWFTFCHFVYVWLFWWFVFFIQRVIQYM